MSMYFIGISLNGLKRHEEALSMLEKVLVLRSRILGSESEAALATMKSLGTALNEIGRYEESPIMYEKLLEIQSRNWGENHANAFICAFQCGDDTVQPWSRR
jgi:tetratricopeptide (TPR) repeat protein